MADIFSASSTTALSLCLIAFWANVKEAVILRLVARFLIVFSLILYVLNYNTGNDW